MSILKKVLKIIDKRRKHAEKDKFTIGENGYVYKNGEIYIGTVSQRTPNRQYIVAHVINGRQVGRACLYGKGGDLGSPRKDKLVAEALEAFKAGDTDKLAEIYNRAFDSEENAAKDSVSDSLTRAKQACAERTAAAAASKTADQPPLLQTPEKPQEKNNTRNLPTRGTERMD